MAMENKRIIQLNTERTTLTDGDYVMVDSDANGTAKYRLDRLAETDTTLSVSGMPADAKKTGDEITALKDDLSELESNGVVPSAEQLLSDNYTVDQTPYLYRQTNSNGADRAIEEIVGGSVVWNQFCFNGNFESTTGWNGQQSSRSASNGVMTLTKTDSAASASLRRSNTSYGPGGESHLFVGHVYFASALIKSPKNTGGRFYLFSNLTNIVNLTASTEGLVGGISKAASSTDDGFNVYYDTSNVMSVGEIATIRNAMLFDLTAIFGSTIADYIYSLEQSSAGAGVAFFRALFPEDYYEYNAGTMMHVSGVSAKETVGKNLLKQTTPTYSGLSIIKNPDGSYHISGKPSSNGSIYFWNNANDPIVINEESVFTSEWNPAGSATFIFATKDSTTAIQTSYADTLSIPAGEYTSFRIYVSNTNTYNFTIKPMIRLASVSDATFEPYEKHTYPLDSSITLRGIPKLDSNNQLYFDGDIYESDGTVTRRYGVVDLGTLTWTISTTGVSGANRFVTFLPSSQYIKPKQSDTTSGATSICRYLLLNTGGTFGASADGYTIASTGDIYFYIDTYKTATAAAFKSAMSGVMLVYELATPTTETAEPYTNPQICDPYGTEEFVSTSLVPVGHYTKYPANLRAAIERVMVQVPEAPTANGTYTLKATRTSSGITYAWTAS